MAVRTVISCAGWVSNMWWYAVCLQISVLRAQYACTELAGSNSY